jgi:hypothetical protein
MKEKLLRSILALEKWVERQNYRGYEPFEGNSSFLHFFTFNNQFLERLLQQLVRQSPINLRPLLGIRKKESTKGRGYMAWGYLRMFQTTSDEKYWDKAEACLNWLDKNKAPGYESHSWGNHFPFTSRGGELPALEPIIVWTSLIGQAFLDAYEIRKKPQLLEIPLSICKWILMLPRLETDSGSCISYVTYTNRMIHNSSMLGAAMLARTAQFVKEDDSEKQEMLSVASEAMRYSCTRQNEDWSWWYGDESKYHWIDNFHTGYNLDSLKCYISSTGNAEYSENLKKGFEYYKTHFFEDGGIPKYYHNRTYPIDSQCAAQAIETLTSFADEDPEALDLAKEVANWWIDNMQAKKGYFYYRKYPFGFIARTPMLHWSQAVTYRALAMLYSRLK